MLKLPMDVFVYGMEMLAKTVQGIQKIADQGIDAVAIEVAQITAGRPPDVGNLKRDTTVSEPDGANDDSAETTSKEEKKMPDNDLSNDRVKVVEYYILSIKPDYEHVLGDPVPRHDGEYGHGEIASHGGEGRRHFPRVKVFTDNMSGADFASWVIASYFQDQDHENLDHKDKKYLRVCYDVICTFAAEEAQYDREEVQVLRQIARSVARIAGRPESDLASPPPTSPPKSR